MEVYLFDDIGRFCGLKTCQPNPLEPGEFLRPINSTDTPPPEEDEDRYAYWDGQSWELKKRESKMTDAEKVASGFLTLGERETLDGASIRPKTLAELVADGLVTAEQHLEIVMNQRKSAFLMEADPLYLDILYDAQKAGVAPDFSEWVAKKDEIKARFPKP